MRMLAAGVFSLLWALLAVWGLTSDNLVFAIGGTVLAVAFLAYAWVIRRRSQQNPPPRG